MQTRYRVRRQQRPWLSLHIVMVVLIFWEPLAVEAAPEAISTCWSDCSVTCGDGTRSRKTRQCGAELHTCDIATLPTTVEYESCNEGTCPATTTTTTEAPFGCAISSKMLVGSRASPSDCYIIHEDGTVEAITLTEGAYFLAKSGDDLIYTVDSARSLRHVNWATKADTEITTFSGAPGPPTAVAIDPLINVAFVFSSYEAIYAVYLSTGVKTTIAGSPMQDSRGMAVKTSTRTLFWSDFFENNISKIDYSNLNSPTNRRVIWDNTGNSYKPTGIFYDETGDDLYWIVDYELTFYRMPVSTEVPIIIASWTGTADVTAAMSLLITDDAIIYSDNIKKTVWCLPRETDDMSLRLEVNSSPLGSKAIGLTFL